VTHDGRWGTTDAYQAVSINYKRILDCQTPNLHRIFDMDDHEDHDHDHDHDPKSHQPSHASSGYMQDTPPRADVDEILRRKRKAREYKVSTCECRWRVRRTSWTVDMYIEMEEKASLFAKLGQKIRRSSS